MQNPGQLLGSLSHTGTQQTSRVHTMLEDANEQRFISFSVPPVHGDLHVVDVRQQHIQLSVADKARVLSQPHWHCSTLGTAHPGAKRDRNICPLAWGPIGSVCSTAPTAFLTLSPETGRAHSPSALPPEQYQGNGASVCWEKPPQANQTQRNCTSGRVDCNAPSRQTYADGAVQAQTTPGKAACPALGS